MANDTWPALSVEIDEYFVVNATYQNTSNGENDTHLTQTRRMCTLGARVKTTWTGAMKGQGRIEGDRLDAPVAIPNELGGTGEGADPKTLLVSSAATCYLMTLVAILQNRKLPVSDLTLVSEGTDPKQADFTIGHQIRVSLTPETTQEQIDQALSALHQADKACVIGNVLKRANVKINVEGSVSIAEISAA